MTGSYVAPRFMLSATVAVVLILSPPAWGDPKLGKLACAELVVEQPGEVAERLGMTVGVLRDNLLVALKMKVRGLRVVGVKERASCDDWIYLNLNLDTVSRGGAAIGYYGNVMLTVDRRAVLIATGKSGSVVAWNKSQIISGPESGAKTHVLAVVDELVTTLAADYYRAGNQ